jgi:16S rRNA (guanine966-N2)-methyltransferase
VIRLTGGEFRGRSIQTPPDKGGARGGRSGHSGVRPTQAKLRQALFNSLQTVIPGARILDLFAGSGALGLEALSRGALSVTFVEESPAALKCLSRNVSDLGVEDRAEVLGESVDRVAKRLASHGPFDIVLADPPYAAGWELKLLDRLPWAELLVAGGRFCLEWGRQKSQVSELPERTPLLVKIREKNYGDSILTTYRHSGGEVSEFQAEGATDGEPFEG